MTAKTKAAPPVVQLEELPPLDAANNEISARVLDICLYGSGTPTQRATRAADALRLHFESLRVTWLIQDAEKGRPDA